MTPLMRLAAVAVPAAVVIGYVIGNTVGCRAERAARTRRQRRAEQRLIRHEAIGRHPAGALLGRDLDYDKAWAELVARLTAEDAL